MMATIETPDRDWDELLEDAIKAWVNHVSKTGRRAPEEYIVHRRLVHNFRELVEQAIAIMNGERGRKIQVY